MFRNRTICVVNWCVNDIPPLVVFWALNFPTDRLTFKYLLIHAPGTHRITVMEDLETKLPRSVISGSPNKLFVHELYSEIL